MNAWPACTNKHAITAYKESENIAQIRLMMLMKLKIVFRILVWCQSFKLCTDWLVYFRLWPLLPIFLHSLNSEFSLGWFQTRVSHALSSPNILTIACNPSLLPKASVEEKTDISCFPEKQPGSKDQNIFLLVHFCSVLPHGFFHQLAHEQQGRFKSNISENCGHSSLARSLIKRSYK